MENKEKPSQDLVTFEGLKVHGLYRSNKNNLNVTTSFIRECLTTITRV